MKTFQVFTNPLLSKEVKAEALQTGNSSLFSAHTNQSSSSSATSSSPSPKMVSQPMDYMDRIVAARYALLVMTQPLHDIPGGNY